VFLHIGRLLDVLDLVMTGKVVLLVGEEKSVNEIIINFIYGNYE
jgi:hypothetical protein